MTTQNPQNPSYTPDETPFFERPIETEQNPYARFNTNFKIETHLFNQDLINKYNRNAPRYTS